jgi:hypothetical protein
VAVTVAESSMKQNKKKILYLNRDEGVKGKEA